MSSNNAFFSIRQTKRSNPECRTTLDALHKHHVHRIQSKQGNIDNIRATISTCDGQIGLSKTDMESSVWIDKKGAAKKELEQLEGNMEFYDYYLKAGPILYEYYDIQNKIQSGVSPVLKRLVTRQKPGSVLAALEDAAGESGEIQNLSEVPHKGEELRRDKLLETYLQRVDPEHARTSHEIEFETFGDCPHCETEMIFSANEANFTCGKCGFQDFVLVDSDKPSYKDPPREVSYYAYKRINHFNEWLAQFQAKETTEIPQEVYDAILVELKKERIMDFRTLKASKVKEILKKMKFNKYYEHIPHIMNRLNGQTAAVMTREIEEKLRYMFKEIQPSFQTHCPKERNNFLSYSYVLYKFCELLELDEYLSCFQLLKNRDKLYVQDKIWQKICADLSWQFIRSI
jgi:hypothetical protein